MRHEPTPTPGSNWKWIGIPVLIACAFMGLLYLAIATEPDYMPANQKKAAGIDPHASHGSSSSEPVKYTAEEHAQHSATEHEQALAEEATHAEESTAVVHPQSSEHGH